MKQITLFEGVDFGGYGGVKPMCVDDCVELLEAVINSDTVSVWRSFLTVIICRRMLYTYRRHLLDCM